MSYHYTLRFPTEAEALAAAESLALLPDDSDDDDPPELVVINQSGGKLFGQAMLITDAMVLGTYDSEGKELTPPTPISGAFVNVILNRNFLPSALRPYQVPYGSAGRVWAGTEPEPEA